MKRLLATTTAAIALGLVASGCGIAADETAATVDGTDISTVDVADWSKADEISSSVTSMITPTEGTTGSEAARAALTQGVQTVAFEEFVNRYGDGVNDEDRAQAEGQGASSSSDAYNKLTERYVAASFALERLAATLDDLDADAAREKLYSWSSKTIGGSYCLEAVLTVPEDAGGFADAAGKNTDLADIETDVEFSPLTDGEQCHTSAALVGFLDPIRNAPMGEWYSETVNVQGMEYTMFVKKGSESAGGLDDQATIELLDSLVESGQAASFLQYVAVSQADVQIDPRYGRWSVTDGTVIAPLTPILAAAADGGITFDDLTAQ